MPKSLKRRADALASRSQCSAVHEAFFHRITYHRVIIILSIYTWLVLRAKGLHALFRKPHTRIPITHQNIRASRSRIPPTKPRTMAHDTSQAQADHELVSELAELAATKNKKQRCVNSTIYEVPLEENEEKNVVKVRSWKMREHDYYKPDPPFPTRARGIFTVDEESNGRHRVVARGYDKFYNIGEVPWTAVSCAF